MRDQVTYDDGGEEDTVDETELISLPMHIGFNRFSEFLPLNNWHEYLNFKASLNEPKDIE